MLGQAELRSPSLARYLGPKVSSVRLHIFTDVGAADIRQPLPGQTASNTFVSVGFGARMRMLNHLSGSLEDAFPLTDGPTTHAGSQRVLFRLTGDF